MLHRNFVADHILRNCKKKKNFLQFLRYHCDPVKLPNNVLKRISILTILKTNSGYQHVYIFTVLFYFILTFIIRGSALLCIYRIEQQMAAWLWDKTLDSSLSRALLSVWDSLSSQSQSQTMMSSLFSKAHVSICEAVRFRLFTSIAYSLEQRCSICAMSFKFYWNVTVNEITVDPCIFSRMWDSMFPCGTALLYDSTWTFFIDLTHYASKMNEIWI